MATLQDKVIAITGAGSGIGAATARECALRGASLALCDINHDVMLRTIAEVKSISPQTETHGTRVDVAKSEDVNAWINQVVNHFQRLDGAVNAAGIVAGPNGGVFGDIVDMTDEHWDSILGVNLTGTFYCLRAELRVMKSGASIVNIASVAGVMGRPQLAAYSTSKHGIIGLTRTAAKEVGERGIRVNVLAPGQTETPMLELIHAAPGGAPSVTNTYAGRALRKLGTAEDVAKTICFALSDDSSNTTGAVFSIDGGVAC